MPMPWIEVSHGSLLFLQGWERRLSESRPGYISASTAQENILKRTAAWLNSTEEPSEGDVTIDVPANLNKTGFRALSDESLQREACTGLESSSKEVFTEPSEGDVTIDVPANLNKTGFRTVSDESFQREACTGLESSSKEVFTDCLHYENLAEQSPKETSDLKESTLRIDSRKSFEHDNLAKTSSEERSVDFKAVGLRNEGVKSLEQEPRSEAISASSLSHFSASLDSVLESSRDWPENGANFTENCRVTPIRMTAVARSIRARKERERLNLFRGKISAAVKIQLWFRRSLRVKRERLERQIAIASVFDESEELTREVAALTIQLAWRKHQRERFEARPKKKKTNTNEKSLSSRSQSSRIYGRSPERIAGVGLQRVRKTASPKVAPSPAAMSYNLAVDLYHPLVSRKGNKRAALVNSGARVRPNSMKRTSLGWTQIAIVETNGQLIIPR